MDPLKMYFLLKMVFFYCYVSLPEGRTHDFGLCTFFGGWKVFLMKNKSRKFIFKKCHWDFFLKSIHMSTVWVCSIISIKTPSCNTENCPFQKALPIGKGNFPYMYVFSYKLVYQRDVCVPCFLQLNWFRNPAFFSLPHTLFQVIRTPFSM